MDLLSKREIRSDKQLESDGFNQEDIKRFRRVEAKYFEAVKAQKDAEKDGNYETALDLEERVGRLGFELKYLGKNPKEVPIEDMIDNLNNSVHQDTVTRDYFERVHNPATAVRAFCVACMNGQTAEVRRCIAVTCPLWAFRLGQNPFADKVLPPAKEIVLADDDETVTSEDEDDHADSEA